MEISILAVMPAPMAPQETPPQTAQMADASAPFTSFLTAATTTNDIADTSKHLDTEAVFSLPAAEISANTPGLGEYLDTEAVFSLPAAEISTNTPGSGEYLDTAALASLLTSKISTDNTTDKNEVPDTASLSSIPDHKGIMTETGLPILSRHETPLFTANQFVPGQGSEPVPSSIPGTSSPVIPASNVQNDPQQFQTLLTPAEKNIKQTAPELATTIPNKTEPLIAQQLQAILKGDLRDAITIQSSCQSIPQEVASEALNGLTAPFLQTSDSADAATISPAQSAILEGIRNPEMSADTAETIHQNGEEQPLNPKIRSLSDLSTTGNQQQETGQQENKTNQQQNTTNLTPTASPGNNEPMSQFIVTGLGTQTATSTQGHITDAHPTAPSPGNPVPAAEIINHLVERFSINPRLQTSKISLNLNPAELGALKIDILVKGDSIKANIAAGSQQIQETIEKNMPKLRAILEQQGFTIEEFKVTLDSSTSDSSAFFQQQSASHRDSAPQPAPIHNETSFNLSLNSAEEVLNSSLSSGVNLNI